MTDASTLLCRFRFSTSLSQKPVGADTFTHRLVAFFRTLAVDAATSFLMFFLILDFFSRFSDSFFIEYHLT